MRKWSWEKEKTFLKYSSNKNNKRVLTSSMAAEKILENLRKIRFSASFHKPFEMEKTKELKWFLIFPCLPFILFLNRLRERKNILDSWKSLYLLWNKESFNLFASRWKEIFFAKTENSKSKTRDKMKLFHKQSRKKTWIVFILWKSL